MHTVNKKLIYDVGMHKGEDAKYYLKKGFKVIAFEANPDLVSACKEIFISEINSEQLRIINGAITDDISGNDKAVFYKNSISEWGTVDKKWAQRNFELGFGSAEICVPVIDFKKCIETYGVPHYMKIDVEGVDIYCLRCLINSECKPNFISVESSKKSLADVRGEIELLKRLGYSSFKAIQQLDVVHQKEPLHSVEGFHVGHKFESGSSGLFGEDLPGEWLDDRQIMNKYKWIILEYKLFGDEGLSRKYAFLKVFKKIWLLITRKKSVGWYDTHARHSSVDAR